MRIMERATHSEQVGKRGAFGSAFAFLVVVVFLAVFAAVLFLIVVVLVVIVDRLVVLFTVLAFVFSDAVAVAVAVAVLIPDLFAETVGERARLDGLGIVGFLLFGRGRFFLPGLRRVSMSTRLYKDQLRGQGDAEVKMSDARKCR